MSVTMYLDPVSQPCRTAILLCKMNGIDYKLKYVNIFDTQDTKSDDYKKINHKGGVPCLQDGDFILTEGLAIYHYLMNKYDVPNHWYPTDIQKRARVNEFLSYSLYAIGGFLVSTAMVFLWRICKLQYPEHRLFTDRVIARYGETTDEEWERRKAALEGQLDNLETYYIRDGPFIGGCEDITIADVVAITDIMQPKSIGYDVIRNRPKLQAWFNRTKARLQPHFDEVHKDILAFGAKHALK